MIFYRSDRISPFPTFSNILLILTSLLGSAAFAEDLGDWSLSLGLGANYGAASELEGLDVKVDYDLGVPRYKGSLARRLGERWWLDVSLSQRKTKAEFSYPTAGGPSNDVGANNRYTSGSLMLSLFREFELGQWIRPYLGIGAGPTWLTYQFGRQAPGDVDEVRVIQDDTTATAFQGVAGFRFPLTRRLDLGIEYEYWRTPDVNLKDLDGNKVDLDQAIHSGWLNLTYYPGSRREAGWGRGRSAGARAGGFYLAGSAGVNWLADTETGTVTFDAAKPGGLAAIALGHSLGPRWRLDLEYAYRSNTPQVVDFGRYEAERRVKGDMTSSSIGLNLHLDLLPGAAIQPTVGIGGGFSRLKYKVRYPDGTEFVDDSTNAAHFQVLAGFNIELSRALDFHTGFRVWITDDHRVSLTDGSRVTADRRRNSSFEFGLLYRLGD